MSLSDEFNTCSRWYTSSSLGFFFYFCTNFFFFCPSWSTSHFLPSTIHLTRSPPSIPYHTFKTSRYGFCCLVGSLVVLHHYKVCKYPLCTSLSHTPLRTFCPAGPAIRHDVTPWVSMTFPRFSCKSFSFAEFHLPLLRHNSWQLPWYTALVAPRLRLTVASLSLSSVPQLPRNQGHFM